MKLHELRSPEGARTRKKRVGRGTGSGHGKTSGRGQKGQLARSQGFRLGFEGGQMPLAQRLPKLGGFRNPFKKLYSVVNLSKLSRFKDGDEITPERLYAEGLADEGVDVKILGAGKLNRKLTVTAHAVSASAREAIERKGGSVTVLNQPKPKRRKKSESAPAAAQAEEPEAEAKAPKEGRAKSTPAAVAEAPPADAEASATSPQSGEESASASAESEEESASASAESGEESASSDSAESEPTDPSE